MTQPFDLIPAPHRDAVRTALAEAFCGTAVDAITPVAGGMSGALNYRVQVEDAAYLMRLVTNPNPMNSPARQFAAMARASEDGIAPRVVHADPEHGIVISDFIASVPWHLAFAEHPEMFATFGRSVRQLHDGPPFAEFVNALQAIDGGLATLASAGVVLPPLLQTFLTRFAGVRAVLTPHLVVRPCHNDLNPGNLLFDGTRIWIVDWESAWQNDPLFDLATLLHWFGFEGERERLLLEGYFGGCITAHEMAKLEVMRQVASCYYAIVFLLLTLQRGEGVPPLDPDVATLPTLAEARMQLRAGTMPLATADDRTRFSLIMVNDAMKRMEAVAFGEAMELLGG